MSRIARVSRQTKETQIDVEVNLDGTGQYSVASGIGFYDHMLEQLARHSLMDIKLSVTGDLHIDGHHTTEDTALALGRAISDALGDRAGITRYGSALSPMDETLTRVALDLSGRPYVVWNVAFSQPKLGEWDSELVREWFYAFANQLGANLHVETLYGVNNHHIVESCFKGLARALREAITIDARKAGAVPSTKGVLTQN
jgi:imidazoleglycerol-phosphate dehydratase